MERDRRFLSAAANLGRVPTSHHQASAGNRLPQLAGRFVAGVYVFRIGYLVTQLVGDSER
jgi:hypothetical protein